jgi:putative iron-regulated protein
MIRLLLALALTACTGCVGDDAGGPPGADAALGTYADIAYASYSDALSAAQDLEAAVDAFLASPSDATLGAARQAWLDAREPYGQTEAYRFANGPIDDADGPEGLLNAWPLDEAYVDYVMGDPGAGIVARADLYPTLDMALLEELNEAGSEENVSAGYHAIEFLLWGQDLSATGPGARPFTDYTTAANAERRGQYLAAASDLLLVHLQELVDAWAPDQAGNYRAAFEALDEDEAIRNVFSGIGTLAKSELAVERIFVAYTNRDQEDEHSCFSDNTHRDIVANAQGIANVYRGRYTRPDGSVVSGASFAGLVRSADEALADRVDAATTAALQATEAIPAPFDQALIAQDERVLAAVDALQDLGDLYVEAARVLGVQVNAELPG